MSQAVISEAPASPSGGGGSPPSIFSGGIGGFLRHREVRGVLYQILTIAILFAGFGWMANNVVDNLQALGKDFSFQFLGNQAGYDISQSLIKYSSLDSNGRAMLVGIMNTALVAFCGVILATIIGLVVAISRLSPNWVISRLAYVYLEAVRNVPVLLHIILVHALVIESFPDARGGEDRWSLFDVFFLSNRGLVVPKPVPGDGFGIVWVAFAVAAGAVFFLRRRSRARRANTGQGIPYFFWISLALLIGLPGIVFLFAGSPMTVSLPEVGRFNVTGGLPIRPEFFALWIALSAYTGAFISEVIRGGILSVSKGQKEAASALGIKRMRSLRLVVMPQAMRVAIPPITNQYLNLTKNSSLAIAVGYQDIVGTIGGTTLNITGREVECMILVLSLYLSFSLFISGVLNVYNRSVRLIER